MPAWGRTPILRCKRDLPAVYRKSGAAHGTASWFLGKVGRHAIWLISHQRSKSAIRILSVALVLAPDDPGLLNLLGIAFFHAGYLRDAWRVLSKAHQALPDNDSIRRNLALVDRARSDANGAAG